MAEEPWRLHQHPLQSRQESKLPSVPNSCDFTTDVVLPGISVSVILKPEFGQSIEFQRSFPCSPPILGTYHLCLGYLTKDSQSSIFNGTGVNDTQYSVSACGRKKLFIFDHSVHPTRYAVSPFLSSPLQKEIAAVPEVPPDARNMHDGIVENEEVSVMELVNLERVDENIVIDEESEMHEDTEEINALLYSDDSDDYSEGVGEDDEVTSTAHSPVETRGTYSKFEKVPEDADEVASSDGSNKKQKLLGGGYKKSSLINTVKDSAKLERSSNYRDVLELSSSMHKSSGMYTGECGKKLKIHKMLKILEKMVPEVEGRGSLQILDGAIGYLKSLRLQAEANRS